MQRVQSVTQCLGLTKAEQRRGVREKPMTTMTSSTGRDARGIVRPDTERKKERTHRGPPEEGDWARAPRVAPTAHRAAREAACAFEAVRPAEQAARARKCWHTLPPPLPATATRAVLWRRGKGKGLTRPKSEGLGSHPRPHRSETSRSRLRPKAATSREELQHTAHGRTIAITITITAQHMHSTAHHSTPQHSTRTAQHSTAQHSTAQHSTA